MANHIKRLQDASDPTDVQRTTLAADVLGRYICNTLQEATDTTSARADARPFDVIVVGGGTFGAAIAEHLWFRDVTHSHRILVLEGGPFVLPEHVQNQPMIGLSNAGGATVDEVEGWKQNDPVAFRRWAKVVWGLPWHAEVNGYNGQAVKFPGLAYCIGGRSLYWGGWSPRPLPEEMPTSRWPQTTVDDLNDRYFDEASRQIGVTESNDFIYGELHQALRQRLFDAIGAGDVPAAVPLGQLPLHLEGVPQQEEDISKLEAPLAVQGRAPRAGYFPLNKFSAVPLLIKGARAAQSEAFDDDYRKRLMVVPHCHVQRLVTVSENGRRRVVRVQTNQGEVDLPNGGTVVIALGTIESARLALLSFGAVPGQLHPTLGRNLMAHLRSNLDIRIPREALLNHAALPKELATSALFVKGRYTHADDSIGHFHLQITASGLGAVGSDSEAELWKKVPDIDHFDAQRQADDKSVVITIRGIGEMEPDNPESHITLDGNPSRVDEFGQRRAFVSIAQPYEQRAGESAQTTKDRALWDEMDRASDQVARAFANGQAFEVFTAGGPVKISPADDLASVHPYTYRNHKTKPGRRDGMGSTHHETGPLRMGVDATTAATNADGRFHDVANAYAVGPSVFPTIGSPNPMLTGIALVRRTADKIMQQAAAPSPEPGYEAIFNGTRGSMARWELAGQGQFSLIDGAIVTYPGNDLGLLWFPLRRFDDFDLRLQFRIDQPDANSGVFVRFRNPRLPVPDRNNPSVVHAYANKAWVAVTTGIEVQIDEWARPDGQDHHRTGAFYGIPLGTGQGQQAYTRGPALLPGQWYDFEVSVRGDTYSASIGGQPTSTFTNTDAYRGRAASQAAESGFVGIQSHTGGVRFRNVRVRPVPVAPASPRVEVSLHETSVSRVPRPQVG
jgi:choline dehydrogenase-like flavoprotein